MNLTKSRINIHFEANPAVRYYKFNKNNFEVKFEIAMYIRRVIRNPCPTTQSKRVRLKYLRIIFSETPVDNRLSIAQPKHIIDNDN